MSARRSPNPAAPRPRDASPPAAPRGAARRRPPDCYAGAKWITAIVPGSSARGRCRPPVSVRLPPAPRSRGRSAGPARSPVPRSTQRRAVRLRDR
ncbi:hypothetical protein CIB84_008231 [Bambusicola thoracicus]|uniref:Uncharacterized protein n=1 Tax=Bambusicola thoracicus TaxID=9083 RepID=A0A2P4SV84_BAMTH|nr:hypothetical protein CIB84_008231 [Bambusicola thoracicus]